MLPCNGRVLALERKVLGTGIQLMAVLCIGEKFIVVHHLYHSDLLTSANKSERERSEPEFNLA